MTTTKKIMIADDDEDDVDFFCEALNDIDASHTCITAADGEDALHKLQNTMEVLPDCIFLDLNMSRMDGKSCLRKLKHDKQLKNIPVIIYTTSSNRKEKEETLSLGAAYFLTKAATFDRIKAGIKEALQVVFPTEKHNEVSG